MQAAAGAAVAAEEVAEAEAEAVEDRLPMETWLLLWGRRGGQREGPALAVCRCAAAAAAISRPTLTHSLGRRHHQRCP